MLLFLLTCSDTSVFGFLTYFIGLILQRKLEREFVIHGGVPPPADTEPGEIDENQEEVEEQVESIAGKFYVFFFKSSAVLHSMKHKGQIALGMCGIHTLLVIKGNAREYYLAPSSDLHAFTGHPSSVIVSCAYTWCFTRT